MEGVSDIVTRVYAAKGDSPVADELIRDYLPFIKSETSKTCKKAIILGESDELSIAMLAFHEAVQGYEKDKGNFLSFASLIMKRRLIDYHRKELRHEIPLRESIYEPEQINLLADEADVFLENESKNLTVKEIGELAAELASFGLNISDIADNCPRQEKTFAACTSACDFAKLNPLIISDLKTTKRLAIAKISEGSGVSRKTLERHRKYIIAVLLIYSNGYDILKNHIKQVLNPSERKVF